MKVIIILANWMDLNGNLNQESISRVEEGIANLNNGYDRLLLMGWQCVPECKISIAEAMKRFCISKGIDEKKLILEEKSRDTVGDAIYSRIALEKMGYENEILLVTSDYHMQRAYHIFKRVYGSSITIHQAIATTQYDKQKEENASLAAFEETFSKVEDGNIIEFEKTMSNDHPFYNGSIHPRIQTILS